MKKLLRVLFLVVCSPAIHSSFGQLIHSENDNKLAWWDDLSGFMNQQNNVTMGMVNEALTKNPPAVGESLERRMALMLIDNVLHQKDAALSLPVQEFLHQRIKQAVQQMKDDKVKQGTRIWKMYNHGFVVRTGEVTLGFDLVRGYSSRAEGFPIDNDVMEQVVQQCDVLFISHRHGDHADPWVAQSFISKGKPVVAALEVFKDDSVHKNITHLSREMPHQLQSLKIQNGKQELKVVVYPGHQGTGPTVPDMNVVVVQTPNGKSFAHTGDQSSNESDWEWIDKINAKYKVDVLFLNCWYNPDILRLIRGFQPKLIIPGHENEMGHTPDHREPYWLTYVRMKGATSPYLQMVWGESYSQ